METALTSHGAIETPFPIIVEEPVMWGERLKPRTADQFKALVDTRTSRVFSIVTNAYKLITHEEAIGRVEDILAGCQGLNIYQTETEFYDDGARMRRTYTCPNVSADIQVGDVVNLRLQLYNSYDRKWPFALYLSGLRLVCLNGMVVGTKFLHISKRHVFHSAEADLAKNIKTAIGRFKLQASQWQRMAEVGLSDKVYRDVMDTMGLGKEATAIVESEFRKQAGDITPSGCPVMTLWQFYNILTAYITLYAVSLNHRVELENRLRVAMQRVHLPRPQTKYRARPERCYIS